jgi:hypothetical protein
VAYEPGQVARDGEIKLRGDSAIDRPFRCNSKVCGFREEGEYEGVRVQGAIENTSFPSNQWALTVKVLGDEILRMPNC